MSTEVIEKNSGYAVLIHVSALLGSLVNFVGIPFVSILIPFVLWLCKRKESSFVDFHGREAIRFQIFMSIYFFFISATILLFASLYVFSGGFIDAHTLLNSFSFYTFLVLLMVVLAFVLVVVELVTPIVAAVKAGDGKLFCYPLTWSPRRK